MKRRAVFMDRDGTISEEIGYVNHPARYRVFPYAGEAVRLLNEAGWLAILVTNQAGVARGYFTEEMIGAVHDRLNQELEKDSARLDAIYYCAHHPSVGEPPYRFDCDCRKPKPGLILRAAQDLDIELARNAGVRSAFVMSGYGRGEWEYQRAAWKHEPDMVAEDLLEAARKITDVNSES